MVWGTDLRFIEHEIALVDKLPDSVNDTTTQNLFQSGPQYRECEAEGWHGGKCLSLGSCPIAAPTLV